MLDREEGPVVLDCRILAVHLVAFQILGVQVFFAMAVRAVRMRASAPTQTEDSEPPGYLHMVLV